MKNEFIPYKQALALKELGFNEPCFAWHNSYKIIYAFEINFVKNNEEWLKSNQCSIQTFSQAFRWFRDKYNLVHEISWSKSKSEVSFDYDIFSLVLPTDDELGDEDDVSIDKPMETYDSLAGKTFRDMEFDSYEGAELDCINKLIKICKEFINQ